MQCEMVEITYLAFEVGTGVMVRITDVEVDVRVTSTEVDPKEEYCVKVNVPVDV
jgi:hypothetical protein